jgi:hypothetical protein
MNPDSKVNQRLSNFFAISFVALFCVVWFARFEWQMLSDDYWYNDDNAQHVAWMWKWKENHFAEHDLMNAAAEKIQPWGYVAVAKVGMLLFNPISFAKYMPLAALFTTCFFAFLLVKNNFGTSLGLAAAVLIGFLTIERMVGFNARAFGFPLLLVFLHFFIEGKWKHVAICLIISALFYQVTQLVALAILGLEGVRWVFLNKKNLASGVRSNIKNMSWVAICALVGVSITLIKSKQINADPNLGPMFAVHDLLSLPMFNSDTGRVDFPGEMRPFATVLKNGFQDPAYMIPIVVVALLLLLASFNQASPNRRFDRALIYLPMAGVGLLVTARLLLPALFLPTRYLTYTYPVFFCMLLVRLLAIRADFFQKWWTTGLLLATLIVPSFLTFEPKNHAQQNYDNYASLFKTVDELPPDHGLIAGPPFPCDMLPMHCKRSVLFSYEGFHALYFKGYWDKMSPRLYDYIDATTTEDPSTVQAFVRKYNVSYLLVDRQLIEQGREFGTFEPFKTYLHEQLGKNSDRNFAISQFPPELYTNAGKKYWVLDCRQWLGQ